jgi:hypothetical protein
MAFLNRFNKTKKKLEEERQERRRLETELAERQRRDKLEREQMEQLHRKQIEQARRELETRRLAQQELERKEKERQRIEREKIQREERKRERDERQREERRKKMEEASAETLCNLRELIRDKYRLDVEIWGLRGVRRPDRWLVEQMMEKADAVMEEIMTTVGVWEHNNDGLWDPAEWERVQDIRRRLRSGGKRTWSDNPPWNEARENRFIGVKVV